MRNFSGASFVQKELVCRGVNRRSYSHGLIVLGLRSLSLRPVLSALSCSRLYSSTVIQQFTEGSMIAGPVTSCTVLGLVFGFICFALGKHLDLSNRPVAGSIFCGSLTVAETTVELSVPVAPSAVISGFAFVEGFK